MAKVSGLVFSGTMLWQAPSYKNRSSLLRGSVCHELETKVEAYKQEMVRQVFIIFLASFAVTNGRYYTKFFANQFLPIPRVNNEVNSIIKFL